MSLEDAPAPNYSIDDCHGTLLCGGFQFFHEAERAALRLAEEIEESVYIYSVGDGDGYYTEVKPRREEWR